MIVSEAKADELYGDKIIVSHFTFNINIWFYFEYKKKKKN